MKKRDKIRIGTFLLGLMAIVLVGCGPDPYLATFDTADTWGTGSMSDVEGNVTDGVYEMYVAADSGLFWATANQSLADGTYEIEATAVEGPLDNGYGLMFMMDVDANDFYLFEISSDGFVWIGRCDGGCEEDIVYLVADGWFESPAVKTGLNQTNVLRAETRAGQMSFFVNDQPVGTAVDVALTSGDVGVAVETYGAGGVRIQFDNFSYVPADS